MQWLSRAALLLVVIAAALWWQRAVVMEMLLPGVLENNMTARLADDLGPGLHVGLCGSGGPMPNAVRTGPCVVVLAGGQTLVFDAASNGVRNLAMMAVNAGEIDALFLTHFHSDHIDGLGELALLRWVQRANTTPLPVYGPEGVTSVVAGFNEAYSQDVVYRHAHHGSAVAPLSGAGMQPMAFAQPEDGQTVTVYEAAGVTVEAFRVAHQPVDPAVGYRISHAGRSVVISGDTAKSANLEAMAAGVDLLVHEALSRELVGMMRDAAAATNNAIVTKIAVDILDYHASPVEAAETARDAGVGHLLYYHIVPPLPAPGMDQLFLRGVQEVFADYTLGEDGTVVSLPANSAAIEISQRL